MKEEITIEVNGREHTVLVDPAMPLLYVLRNQLQINGPKFGCGLGQCGACMILLDSQPVPSCIVSVSAAKEKPLRTLEGLVRDDGELHPVQQAFVEEQAAQCGYCLNGMVVSAVALLEQHSIPDDAAIRQGMQRNLCRCGTQSRIIKAIKRAAEKTGS